MYWVINGCYDSVQLFRWMITQCRKNRKVSHESQSQNVGIWEFPLQRLWETHGGDTHQVSSKHPCQCHVTDTWCPPPMQNIDLMTTLPIPASWATAYGVVRGLTETPLFVHTYTRGCWIYSQSAISKTPSLTHYLLYIRIPQYHICSCEVLSTPHSHLYIFLNTTYSCAVLGLSSTQ